MGSIEKRELPTRTSWRAIYRTPDGKQRSRSLERKRDAERFLNTVAGSKMLGSYVDPALSRVTVGDWARLWIDGQSQLTPSTRERYADILREHVEPGGRRSSLQTCRMLKCRPG